ncbi:hypothetical protein [Natrarchaeobius oligotrophus]|uniref:Uncharacterized protein n=1 Tax=Natrarchaeobius chitinivorans TaxID=1679083 RepID=A0A3N6MD29_NATCH|nr:hypothetical protein [Natrarchaeobius chitinivorans]RQH01759.1 hypothetical protein EA472_05405 [Natrarchaeobius chitinivorans]
MDSSTDFAALVSRVRTQSKDAAGSDTERVTIRSLEGVDPGSLSTLLETAESEDVPPGDLVFVLSRANADSLLEREADLDDREDLEDRLGRPVRVEERMPDETVLLLAPDAVDGEQIVDPTAIACGVIGSDS